MSYEENEHMEYTDVGEYPDTEVEADMDANVEAETDMDADAEEQRRLEARAKRRERMRREKELQLKRRKMIAIAIPAAGILLTILLAAIIVNGKREKNANDLSKNMESTQVSSSDITLSEDAMGNSQSSETDVNVSTNNEETETGADVSQDNSGEEKKLQIPETIRYTAAFGNDVDGFLEEEVKSTYGIVIDVEKGQVLAASQPRARISPASMTKILTVLVAAEFVEDLDDKVTITREETDYAFSHDCSAVNFDIGEVVTVRDLFYGTILPSGADAALALAKYVAGSHEAFVDLMNEKLKAMGLSASTHFTNCVGLYDENHYSTVYDMAMILQAAVNNEICRDVLSAHTYTTSKSAQHPDGILISNWFLRRIEDKDTHGEVLCAKTGFVVESRNCAASYAIDHSGKGYICVTADAYNGWRCIYDHVALYQKYLK